MNASTAKWRKPFPLTHTSFLTPHSPHPSVSIHMSHAVVLRPSCVSAPGPIDYCLGDVVKIGGR